MLRLPTNPLGPFWLEDLAYSLADGVRRLPARAAQAWARIGAYAARRPSIDDLFTHLSKSQTRSTPVASPSAASQAARLEEPEEWALATEPLAAADTGTARAVALHKAATEQLDALTYVLNRLRDEVRPLMTYARFADEPVHTLPEADRNEAALQALLTLARENALTHPGQPRKGSSRSAA